jgi:cysteinyl-tRNA synthetase, unknown class
LLIFFQAFFFADCYQGYLYHNEDSLDFCAYLRYFFLFFDYYAMKLFAAFFSLTLFFSACFKPIAPAVSEFRPAMRTLVQDLSSYAKAQRPDFLIIAQDDATNLLTDNAELSGLLQMDYLAAVDAFLQKEVFYQVVRTNIVGSTQDRISYEQQTNQEALNWLNLAKQHRPVFVVDICGATLSNYETSYQFNTNAALIATQATTEKHDLVPLASTSYHNQNNNAISSLNQVRNFLYIKDIRNYGATPQVAINALAALHEDLLIIDAFWGEVPLTTADIALLKSKPNGARRLVIANISIGAAEARRFYRQTDWDRRKSRPEWVGKQDEALFHGNHVVNFSSTEWRTILFGSPTAYLDRVIAAGFDGASFGYCNAYLWFENHKM